MIKKIRKLKNFGIFSDFTAEPSLNDFSKYNLFYGWNGCGKTTLSKLFYYLQNEKSLPDDFLTAEFNIQTDSVTEITNSNKIKIENLKVFNEDFVKENIDWNNQIKSILLISNEKMIEVAELKRERDKYDGTKDLLRKNEEIFKESGEMLQNLLSAKAKQIKVGFQTIDTKDTYYFNYDKGKLVSFLLNNKEKVQNSENILGEASLKNLIEIIKPNERQEIKLSIKKPDFKKIVEIEDKISDLLNTSITNGVIERLKNNADIAVWIESGLLIHEKHKGDKCEFCGNTVDLQRLEDLRRHFSDELFDLRKKLEFCRDLLEKDVVLSNVSLDRNLLHKDLQSDADRILLNVEKETRIINDYFNSWFSDIDEKIKNPSKVTPLGNKIQSNFLENYIKEISSLEVLIEEHNLRVVNFDSGLKTNQERLELHYASEFEKDPGYFRSLEKINTWTIENGKLREQIAAGSKRLFNLEKALSNESLGADEFNKKLAKFIGHEEIKLEFDEKLGGYKIIRKHNNELAKNLSEGEKTAVAFVYFITKLGEKEDLKREIVVIDDPISSFDSNNLFSAYSFIVSELEVVNQLFILTHNFTFFRLIRDWIKGKNKKDNLCKSKFFQICVLPRVPRESIVENINPTLVEYNSEYHFVFSRLYKFKDHGELSLEDAFQIANLSRKLLESFLSFKFPEKRNDFKLLLDTAIDKLDLNDNEKRQKSERVYRFISKYSHLQIINFGDDAENNLIGESTNIVNDILEIINVLDTIHHDEMIKICIQS